MSNLERLTSLFEQQIAGLAAEIRGRDPAASRRIEEVGAAAVEYVAQIIEEAEAACRQAFDEALGEAWAAFKRARR